MSFIVIGVPLLPFHFTIQMYQFGHPENGSSVFIRNVGAFKYYTEQNTTRILSFEINASPVVVPVSYSPRNIKCNKPMSCFSDLLYHSKNT